MNILAHFHLAMLANSSLIGNSVADFVKGDPYIIYSKEIADGIMLHRKIDVTIDSMLEVKHAKFLFRTSHHRVAPITLDLVWDHFLSKKWQDYCPSCSLIDFNNLIKQQIEPYLSDYPVEYQRFMAYMWRHQWLENYADLNFIAEVLVAMTKRHPKLIQLQETIIDIKENYTNLENLFTLLYPKMITRFSR